MVGVGLMRIVDFRSDTVTLPTDEMLEAIKEAELGDDTFREDPTVIKLEQVAAEKVGKEAALLVTSGTQGNIVSLMTHTKPGEEIILEANAHTFFWETAGLSALAGVQPRLIKGENGVMNLDDVKASIRIEDIHCPLTTLICFENTHNHYGGLAIKPEDFKPIYEIAQSEDISVHTDGARIFNAAVALNIDVKKLTQYTDSVMFCLSKGLSCPVGSIIAGDSDFIEKARKARKMLGGGMRQAGIIAAPGIIALEKMIDRLKDDHKNARLLAEGLSQIERIKIDLDRVQTNIVIFNIEGLDLSEKEFLNRLEEKKIRALGFFFGKNNIRMTTHRGIEKEDVQYTIDAIKEIASKK